MTASGQTQALQQQQQAHFGSMPYPISGEIRACRTAADALNLWQQKGSTMSFSARAQLSRRAGKLAKQGLIELQQWEEFNAVKGMLHDIAKDIHVSPCCATLPCVVASCT